MDSLFEGKFEISWTSLKDYRTCPHRFLLNYEQKQKGIFTRSGNCRRFVEGWCIHKCLELWNKLGHWAEGWVNTAIICRENGHSHYGSSNFTFVENDKDRTNLVFEVLQDYLSRNTVYWKEGESQEIIAAKILEGLDRTTYWIDALDYNNDKVESEHWFSIFLPEMNVTVRGAIDLIDHRKPDILDLKFSKSGYTDWDQLLWYDMILSLELGQKIQAVHTFNPLMDHPLDSREYSKEDTMVFGQEVQDTVNQIRAGEFEPHPGKSRCYECLVQKFCTHRI